MLCLQEVLRPCFSPQTKIYIVAVNIVIGHHENELQKLFIYPNTAGRLQTVFGLVIWKRPGRLPSSRWRVVDAVIPTDIVDLLRMVTWQTFRRPWSTKSSCCGELPLTAYTTVTQYSKNRFSTFKEYWGRA